MSSTPFPAGLVPFEDLFSKPPNPMLGPSLTRGRCNSDQGGCGELTCSQSGPGPSPGPSSFGDLAREPSSPRQTSDPPPLDPSPDGPEAIETQPSGAFPSSNFVDLFSEYPNPMLSSSVTLSGPGSVACEPLLPGTTPALPSPGPGWRPGTASPDSTTCSPGPLQPGSGKRSSQGGGSRLEGKRKGKEAGPPAAKEKQSQKEDFDQLLKQYIQAREAPKAAAAPPPTKKGARPSAAARKADRGRAKKRKRAGLAKAQGPRGPVGPPAAPERAPVSEEFIQKNTKALGSRRVCKYFLAGRCIRGDQCRLDHQADGLKFQQLCKFYVQGYCTRGDHCRFLHHEFPCKFFHTGAKCYQAEHCSFSHAPLTPETEGLLRAALGGPAPS